MKGKDRLILILMLGLLGVMTILNAPSLDELRTIPRAGWAVLVAIATILVATMTSLFESEW